MHISHSDDVIAVNDAGVFGVPEYISLYLKQFKYFESSNEWFSFLSSAVLSPL